MTDGFESNPPDITLAGKSLAEQALFDAAPCLLGICTQDFNILWLNHLARQTLDQPTLMQSLSYAEKNRAILGQRSKHSPQQFDAQLEILRQDQTPRLMRATFNQIKFNGSKQWLFVLTDVTDENNLSQTLDIITRHAHIGIWNYDLKTTKLFWSREIYELLDLDYQTSEATFDNFFIKVHAEDAEQVKQAYEQQVVAGKVSHLPFRVVSSTGDIRWLESRSEIIYDQNSLPIRLQGTLQDITLRKTAEDAQLESQEKFMAFLESNPAIAFIKDREGKFIYVNNKFYTSFHFTPEQVIGKTAFDLWPESVAKHLVDVDNKIFESETISESIECVPSQDENRYWHTIKFTFTNPHGQKFLGCTALDVTDSKRTEALLQQNQKLLDTSQVIAKLGGWEVDAKSMSVFWNDHTYRLLETSPDNHHPTFTNGMDRFRGPSRNLIETALLDAIAKAKSFDIEVDMFTDKGNRIDARISGLPIIENDQVVKVIGILQDITAQKNAERDLEKANAELAETVQILKHIAQYDALTHLPNRALLADRMQQALAHHERSGLHLAVAFLDLDKFKAINDQYGHSVGDKLLVQIAVRMKNTLREDDTISRIGGDEFVLVLGDLSSPEECEPLIQRLLRTASEPIVIDDLMLQVSASIGLTIFPQDKADAEQLLRHADQAMYIAKERGGSSFHVFDIAQDVAAKTQRESLAHVKKALLNNEFVLYYQPKVNMRTGVLVGAEALIRWQHPERGLLAPGQFLPIIENQEISIALGEWVIDSALKQIAHWLDNGMAIPVSVNVGAYQLQQPDFPHRLHSILLNNPRVSAHLLEIEILETSALEDIYLVSSTLESCQRLGVKCALDDFGTGYSSLAYLKRLKADYLKIDQTFVRDMLEDEDDLAIIKGIISLAEAFKRGVVAEGVETAAHGAALLALGCELAQGYGIARPLPAEQLLDWYAHWYPDESWKTKSAN